jgi:hypothetical protein
MARSGLFAALSLALGLSACSAPAPPPTSDAAADPERQAPCAALLEYEGGAMRGRILCGAPVADVEAWLRALEAKPKGSPGSSKPLAWLHLGLRTKTGTLLARRSVGLSTDVMSALDRPLSAEELAALRSLFAGRGEPFGDRVAQP